MCKNPWRSRIAVTTHATNLKEAERLELKWGAGSRMDGANDGDRTLWSWRAWPVKQVRPTRHLRHPVVAIRAKDALITLSCLDLSGGRMRP